MGTHNICFYKEKKKKVRSALIGVCAVIRSNTVFRLFRSGKLYCSTVIGHLIYLIKGTGYFLVVFSYFFYKGDNFRFASCIPNPF